MYKFANDSFPSFIRAHHFSFSIFTLRSTLSVKPPTITTTIFDYWTCAVQLTNYIKIPFIPLVLSIPSWMILHFEETDLDSRLLKVWWHEDSWTIEGEGGKPRTRSIILPSKNGYRFSLSGLSF